MLPFNYFMHRTTPGAKAFEIDGDVWRLEIPGGPDGRYRLAQLDDCAFVKRRRFRWKAPCTMELQARASAQVIPGTWGFGFWNDPFSLGVSAKTGGLRLPALPNAAWYFFAGPPNYLSLREDQPAQGWLVQVFQAPRNPAAMLWSSILMSPLAVFPAGGRWLRRLLRRGLRQDAGALSVDPTQWHTYHLDWRAETLQFHIDGALALTTNLLPRGPLGLVVWIDNQYAAWGADGRARWGTLANQENTWIEVKDFRVYS